MRCRTLAKTFGARTDQVKGYAQGPSCSGGGHHFIALEDLIAEKLVNGGQLPVQHIDFVSALGQDQMTLAPEHNAAVFCTVFD